MTFRIRQAEPSDLPAVARLQVDAFSGTFRRVFPTRRAAVSLMEAVLQAECGRQVQTLVAEEEGEVIGMLSLRTGDRFPSAAIPRLIRRAARAVRPWHWPRLLVAGMLLVQGTPGPGYSVDVLAVAGGSRRRGVGTALLQEAERRTRENGQLTLGLHVLGDNAAARQLYERRGYRVRAWHLTPWAGWLFGHASHAYMTKILEPMP